jgi:hypothetical protein
MVVIYQDFLAKKRATLFVVADVTRSIWPGPVNITAAVALLACG